MTIPDPQTVAGIVPAHVLPAALELMSLFRAGRNSVIVSPRAKSAAEALRVAGILEQHAPDQYRISTDSSVII